MSETALVVSTREGVGKGAARKLRAAGRIPGVLYGRGRDSLPVALVKELQRDPLRGVITHADLYQVDLTRTIEVDVPVHLVGKPKGIDMGGVLDHILREVRVECLPRAIPEAIEVDVSEMEINDVLHVSDLPLPADVKLITDPELGVAHVAVPAAEEVPVAAEVAPSAEVPVEGEVPAAAEGAETKEKGKEKE